MAGRASRTYKLQLSDEGLSYFIGCHSRLVRAVNDLIPYGMTLYVGMAIFARLDCGEQLAELQDPGCARLVGRSIHFVGFSPALRSLITRILADIADAGEVHASPKVSKLYIAGLMALNSAETGELHRAYHEAKEINARSRIVAP